MAARLSDCLVRDGTLPGDVVRAATARQAVYGGTLDTALLELGALDEPTLWGALATATGVPIPDAALFENPDPKAAVLFDAEWSRRCRAVPVGQRDGALQICCIEPVDEAQLAQARDALGLPFDLYVVPEVRLAAARQAVYGEPMPPRLLRILAQLLGAQPVRKWVKALAPKQAAAKAAAAAQAARSAEPPSPQTSAPPAVTASPVKLDEGELAEAEFDVPVNTSATEAVDILESRPSGAQARDEARAAADEVARALGQHDGGASAPGATTAPPPGNPTGVPRAITIPGMPGPAVAPAPQALSAPLPEPEPMADEKEEQLCTVADDAEAGARLAALRVLRTRLVRPRVRQLADKLRADLEGPVERAVLAAGALGELRDGKAVPALIKALAGAPALARTAERALVEIAQQDFGGATKKWLAWWEAHKGAERVEWLLEGLSHKSSEIRFSSSEELRLLTGEYFGYHFDLPKREREEARARWQSWWYQSGRARLPDRR